MLYWTLSKLHSDVLGHGPQYPTSTSFAARDSPWELGALLPSVQAGEEPCIVRNSYVN